MKTLSSWELNKHYVSHSFTSEWNKTKNWLKGRLFHPAHPGPKIWSACLVMQTKRTRSEFRSGLPLTPWLFFSEGSKRGSRPVLMNAKQKSWLILSTFGCHPGFLAICEVYKRYGNKDSKKPSTFAHRQKRLFNKCAWNLFIIDRWISKTLLLPLGTQSRPQSCENTRFTAFWLSGCF